MADSNTGANLGFETKLWLMPDKLRNHLQGSAKQPTIGRIIDNTMVAIEKSKDLEEKIVENLKMLGFGKGDIEN